MKIFHARITWKRILLFLLILLIVSILGETVNNKIFSATYIGNEHLIEPLPMFNRPCNEVYLPTAATTTKTGTAGWPFKVTVVSEQPVIFYCGDDINKKYEPKFNSTDFAGVWQYNVISWVWTLVFLSTGLTAWKIYANSRY